MRPDHVPICPGCRTLTGERLDVRTVERVGDTLVCACGRRYPIVDGVPIVLADPSAYLRDDVVGVVERDLEPEVAALLVAGGPDDAPYPRLLEHLSIYLDAHWGDRATPAPDGPGAGPAMAAVLDRLAARAAAPVKLAVELGCSAGRGLAALAAGAEHVVGLDLHHGVLRRARRLLAGEPVAYGRRIAGRHYRTATIAPLTAPLGPERVTLLCGDALDPPLVPGVYQRVVALNLVDSVRRPAGLLRVLDGLCAPGGELILTSPYAWSSTVMEESERLGEADPAATLRTLLCEGTGLRGRYVIEDEADLPWSLRRDARSAVTYCIHYLRARRI